MGSRDDLTYDIVGVGFGPSNLSLAIALEEMDAACDQPMRALFLERQPTFSWHRGMLLPSAKMQISFLKDLATYRNPTSRFSFVSYLHATGRLPQFVNNKDFFPTRREFHAYLEWAQANFADIVSYGTTVTAVRPRRSDGPVEVLEIDAVGAGGAAVRVTTRNVVISTGLVPRMPEGVARGERVWHSGEFLERFGHCDQTALRRVAVVGAGQSAAELVRFVHETVTQASVVAILPPYGYTIADSTPFANRVFDPAAVDDYFYSAPAAKDAIWGYHKNTNYSVVDEDVLRDLHQRVYEDEVAGSNRIRFVNLARVTGVTDMGDRARVGVHSSVTDRSFDIDVDVLVCATGYDPMDPVAVLGDLAPLCGRDETGRLLVGRDYRLATTADVRAGIYIQGGTEHTHGLSSSLLSNLAVRSGEIARSVRGRGDAALTDRLLVAEPVGS